MNRLTVTINENRLVSCFLCQKVDNGWLTTFYTENYWSESEFHTRQDIFTIESDDDLFADFERITDGMERHQGFRCKYTKLTQD